MLVRLDKTHVKVEGQRSEVKVHGYRRKPSAQQMLGWLTVAIKKTGTWN